MKKILTIVGLAIGLLIGLPQVASAHHPVLSVETGCQDDGTWTATFTARVDADRPSLTWRIVSPSGYAPAGSQQATLANTFTRTVTVPVATAAVTETVTARWSNGAQATRSITAGRPMSCPTTTTSTSTTVPAITSTSTSTSTSIPETSSTLVTTTAPTTTAPVITSTSSPSTSSTSTTSSVPGSTSTTSTSTSTVASSDTTTTVEPSPTSTGVTPSSTTTAPSLAPADRLTTTTVPTLPQTGAGDTLVAVAAILISVGGWTVLATRRR